VTDAPFTFIVGTGRCGSTLLSELVCLHPEVGFLSNVDDRAGRPLLPTRYNGRLYRDLPVSRTGKKRFSFFPSEGYGYLARSVSPIVNNPVRDLTADDAMPWLADRFASAFNGLAQAAGAPSFVHKFTGWPRARFIDACLPGSPYVHVARDGRAVAASLLQVGWWKGHLGPESWGFGPLSDEHRTA